jgi:phosphate:Na+ symporter
LCAIVLFLHGLQGFSREIEDVGGDVLKDWLGRLTRTPWRGVSLGGLATAIVQSSSAIVALALAFVDSGVLSYRSGLGVVLGANIGTTSTAWLISFNLEAVGPFFIVAGTLVSFLPWRISMFGKAAFYFGLIFFGLELVSGALRPLGESSFFHSLIHEASTPIVGVLVGVVLTVIVQSSTLVTGLCILLVQQNILGVYTAVPIIIGTNVGTTLKGLLITLSMKAIARRLAVANVSFNVVCTLLVIPFLVPFTTAMTALSNNPGISVAWAQFLFNLGMSGLGLVLMRIFRNRLSE